MAFAQNANMLHKKGCMAIHSNSAWVLYSPKACKTSFRQSRKNRLRQSTMIHHTTVVLERVIRHCAADDKNKDKDNDSWCLCTTYRLTAILLDEEEDGDKSYATPPLLDDGTTHLANFPQSYQSYHTTNLSILSFGLWLIQKVSVDLVFLSSNLWNHLWRQRRLGSFA